VPVSNGAMLTNMMRLLCFFHIWHKWRYLGDFTTRQCERCKSRQWAWLNDTGYTWLSEEKLRLRLSSKA